MGEMADISAGDLIIRSCRSPFRKKTKYNKVCRMCKQNGLYWVNTDDGWRLYDSETEEIHVCEVFKCQ